MKTPKYARFFEKLSQYVAAHPGLTYTSEGDSPVEVVKLSAAEVREWTREANTVDADLIAQVANGVEGWAGLAALFVDGSKAEVKFVQDAPAGSDYTHNVYFLNRFGPYYVGCKVGAVWT